MCCHHCLLWSNLWEVAALLKGPSLLSLLDWVSLWVRWLFSNSFLPMLAAGQTGQWNGRYKPTASKGVVFLSEWRDRLQCLVCCKGGLFVFLTELRNFSPPGRGGLPPLCCISVQFVISAVLSQKQEAGLEEKAHNYFVKNQCQVYLCFHI